MHSYPTLLAIIAIQLAAIGGGAIFVQRWIRQQDNKIHAKYHLLKLALAAAWTLLVASVTWTLVCLFEGKDSHFLSMSGLIILIVILSNLLRRYRRLIRTR